MKRDDNRDDKFEMGWRGRENGMFSLISHFTRGEGGRWSDYKFVEASVDVVQPRIGRLGGGHYIPFETPNLQIESTAAVFIRKKLRSADQIET